MPEATLHSFANHREFGVVMSTDGGSGEKVIVEFGAADILVEGDPGGLRPARFHSAGDHHAQAFERLESAGRKELPASVSPDEIREKSTAYVAGLTPTSKAERMRTLLELYLTGKSIGAIVTETGFGQGTVSAHLNEIQNGAAVQLIRTPTKKQGLERLRLRGPTGCVAHRSGIFTASA